MRKKIIYIVLLILGIIGTIGLIVFIMSIVYYGGGFLFTELAKTPLRDHLIILGIVTGTIGSIFALFYSPMLIGWSWNKLKNN